MVKKSLTRVEENAEICCSERIKNLVKNFQHLFNLEVLPIGQHLKIPIYHLLLEFGKIGKSSLEQHSNIPVFNLCVYMEKM